MANKERVVVHKIKEELYDSDLILPQQYRIFDLSVNWENSEALNIYVCEQLKHCNYRHISKPKPRCPLCNHEV